MQIRQGQYAMMELGSKSKGIQKKNHVITITAEHGPSWVGFHLKPNPKLTASVLKLLKPNRTEHKPISSMFGFRVVLGFSQFVSV